MFVTFCDDVFVCAFAVRSVESTPIQNSFLFLTRALFTVQPFDFVHKPHNMIYKRTFRYFLLTYTEIERDYNEMATVTDTKRTNCKKNFMAYFISLWQNVLFTWCSHTAQHFRMYFIFFFCDFASKDRVKAENQIT